MVKSFINWQNQPTPPTQPLSGRPEMVQNEAGGYVWQADKWERLMRFLILGTENNAYYATAQELTKQSYDNLVACLLEDANVTLHIIKTVWQEGRAPRQQPVFFALAAASGVGLKRIPCNVPNSGYAENARRQAYETASQVCKTLAHYAMFLQFALHFGGSRTGLKNVVKRYLELTPVDDLAYQFAKYGTRSGWTVGDLIKWSHPSSANDERRKALFEWALNDEPDIVALDSLGFDQIVAVEYLKSQVQGEYEVDYLAEAILERRLTREMIPTELLKNKKVWDALSKDMPAMALTRTLHRMGAVRLITQQSCPDHILSELRNIERMKKARVHPMDIFQRIRVYFMGRDQYNTWEINRDVLAALDNLMEALMNAQPASDKRVLLALDTSGSMFYDNSRYQQAAAVGMLFARTEPTATILQFSDYAEELPINPQARYDQVRDLYHRAAIGRGTNGASAIQWATERKQPVDVFVYCTDGEFWAGDQHLNHALEEHRRVTGGEGRLAVFNFVAYNTTPIDPKDNRQMNFVGWDPSAFSVLDQFIRGEL